MKGKHIYVIGTGYSHDGSACLLKDGKICVAIEKERLTRRKHDGYNDTAAIQYCLDSEGITIGDIDLVVQNSASSDAVSDYFGGERIFARHPEVPIYTISHHLAHAYSTIGTCSYNGDFNIMIIDGSGSSYDQCMDLPLTPKPDNLVLALPHVFYEKDSYYNYDGKSLRTIYKDFSEFGLVLKNTEKYTMTKHSIGGAYEMFSKYCFGNLDDTGKLMGLAPYGRDGVFKESLFDLGDGRFFVNYDVINKFQTPARSFNKLKDNFQYYSDVAFWVQKETERAILYLIGSRLEMNYSENMCYAGGVALNAVANAKILEKLKIKNLYMQPAAGDNGISIGCAYYGWLEILKREKVRHTSSTFFGKLYDDEQVSAVLKNFHVYEPLEVKPEVDDFFRELHNYKPRTSFSGSLLQVNLEDIGIYQLEFDKGNLAVHYGIKSSPTSRIKLDGQSFLRGIQNKAYFNELSSSGRLEVFNPKEVSDIFNSIDFSGILQNMGRQSGNGKILKQPFKYRKTVNLAVEVAGLLANGKIIGLFQGGAEFGPRALGNRSIMADPRIKGIRDFINAKIKLREDFRPFAPAVLREDLLVYFQKEQESPYMIMVNEIRESWRDQLISVIHKDGSSRVQTVSKGWNDGLYEILTEFKKLTGLSVLLNTSFNKKGMPIVETPREALDFFIFSDLDCLVIGNYIVEPDNSSLHSNPVNEEITEGASVKI